MLLYILLGVNWGLLLNGRCILVIVLYWRIISLFLKSFGLSFCLRGFFTLAAFFSLLSLSRFSLSYLLLALGLPFLALFLSLFVLLLALTALLAFLGLSLALLVFLLARLSEVPLVLLETLEFFVGLVLGEMSPNFLLVEVFVDANLDHLVILFTT